MQDFNKSNCLDINTRVDYVSLNLMFNIFNNVAPSYMCDINRISHRHNTRQTDSAYVVPRVKGQGSKSFKGNGSKLWNELPTNVKQVQQKVPFKKECKALLMTRMKEKEEMNVVPFFFYYLFIIFSFYFYYIFIVRVTIFFLFLGYIYLHVSLYIVCLGYPLNVRSTIEIRRSHLGDFFLLLPFL